MADLHEQLQATLGDAFTIQRELGGGGMSRVFLAEEVALGRPIVLKVLPPEMAAAVTIERFRHEIRLAASLQHPHIVALHSAGQAGELLYYTMPYVDGESTAPSARCSGSLRSTSDSQTGVMRRTLWSRRRSRGTPWTRCPRATAPMAISCACMC